MTLTVLVGGAPVTVIEGSVKVADTIDQRSTASFSIRDDTGTASYPANTPVSISDSALAYPFTGYINDTSVSNLYPNATDIVATNVTDNHFLADKRYYPLKEYTNRYAGDIFSDILTKVLSAEGISTTGYAVDHDTTNSDFSTGTLTNVVASTNVQDGDLELSNSGTTFTKTETVTDWNAGTLTNMATANGQLILGSNQAIHFNGTAEQGTNNNFCYMKIWGGSQSIASGDTLRYGLWVSSTSPAITCGVDLLCSDGTALRSTQSLDQNGIGSHPANDLSGYANDQRYYRTIDISALAGKTVSDCNVALEGDPAGRYDCYIDSIQIYNNSNALKVTLFNGTLQQTTQISNVGYSAVSIGVVTAYYPAGTYTSNAYSIAAPVIANTSLISWSANMSGNGANKVPYIVLQTSLDGGVTWQTATNHQPVPGLLAGMNLASQNIMIQAIFSVAGPDPTVTPAINSITVTITPSYTATKTDVLHSESASTLNTGTLTNTIETNNMLTLNGYTRNYDTQDFSNQTIWSTSSTPTQQGFYKALALRCDGGTDIRARLDWAGQWQNFIFEVDINILDSVGNYGLVYRTTGWQNNSNTFAYAISISTTAIELGKGTNSSSGGGSYTPISTFTTTFASNTWYHVKVVVNGNSHQIYMNDVLYINVTDSSYTAAGYFGLRHYNSSGSRHSGYFDNPGVVASLTGTRVSPSLSLSSAGSVLSTTILWQATAGSTASVLMETSINGGSTWSTVTNGGAIPGLTAGTSLSGKSLLWRTTLTAANANAGPTLTGISVFVLGAYSASGNRIGLALSLANVGRCGSANVSWNALLPTNTTLLVDSSLDNITYSNIGSGASGIASIAGINQQPDPTMDNFNTNTSTNYTSTNATGGATATWNWDTTNSRLTVSGGTNALLLYNTATAIGDVELLTVLDQADNTGLVWRWQNASNYYEVVAHDASSATNTNTVQLYKIVSNVRTQIGSNTTISFTRGHPHKLHVSHIGSAITIDFDGTSILTGTDNSISAGGKCGFRNSTVSGGSAGRFYLFWLQPYGDDVSAKTVYTRVRLTSSDPTATPQLLDISTSVRSPNLQTGALIPQTSYSVVGGNRVTTSQIADDLAKQSNYLWKFKGNTPYFNSHTAQPAPFILTDYYSLNSASSQIGDLLLAGAKVDNINDLYRNSQWLTGGVDTVSRSEQLSCDGIRQSWLLGYNVDSITSIVVNGQNQTFGIKGQDTGKTFYYVIGNNTLIQDSSLTPYDSTIVPMVNYAGRVTITVNTLNPTQISARAAIDGTSGLIEVAEDAAGLNKQAMIILGAGRIAQYGVMGRTLQITVQNRAGLAPAQLLSVFLTKYNITDGQFLITDVETTWRTTRLNGTQTRIPYLTIKATEGPVIGDWTKFYSRLGS